MIHAHVSALATSLEEASNAAVILTDGDHRIVRWSERAAALLGQTAEVLGRPAHDVLELPHGAPDGGCVFAWLSSGRRWAASPDPAASGPSLSWLAEPMKDDDGAYVGAIFRVSRVQAARRPPLDPHAVSASFERAMQALTIVDRGRRIVAANAAFRDIAQRATGRRPHEGEDILAFIAPGAETGFLSAFELALAGEDIQRRVDVRFANGEEFELVVQYSPLDGDHVLFGFSPHPEPGVNLRRELLERSLAVAPFAVLIADTQQPEVPIVYASDAIERLTGYSPSEVLGRDARFLLQAGVSKQPALQVVRDALKTGSACDVVVRIRHRGGRGYLCRFSLTPVRDEFGLVSHVIGILEDVTERDHLLDRLRSLESRQLSQLMMAGAVHDLRNMLTIVAWSMEELEELGPELVERLVEAKTATQRANALARLLLSPISRAEIEQSVTVISELFDNVRTLAKYVLPRSIRLEIALNPACRDAFVHGSPGALEQVLMNLVLNAREAMAEGDDRGKIVLSASPSGETITFTVQDDGPGIPDDVLPHVFEPYFTTKPVGKGTGVGLATCLRIVQSAGGTIEARSGAGATFTITLPVAQPHRFDAPSTTMLARAAFDWKAELVVVEPDTTLRAAMCAALRRRGARVHDAGDSETAAPWIRAASPDAVLLLDDDREMEPLAKSFLELGSRRSVVLLGAEPHGLADARLGRLPKPFGYDALIAEIRRVHDR